MESIAKMGLVGHGRGEAYWVMGAKYTFKINGADNGGAYMMFEAEVPPAPGPPPHLHTLEDEMFYVLEGELTVMLDGQVSKAPAGTTIILPRNIKHTFWNESGAIARALILASPAPIEDFFKEIGQRVLSDDETPPPVTPEMVTHLYDTAERYGMVLDRP